MHSFGHFIKVNVDTHLNVDNLNQWYIFYSWANWWSAVKFETRVTRHNYDCSDKSLHSEQIRGQNSWTKEAVSKLEVLCLGAFMRKRPRRTKSREPRVGARCAICRQSTWGEDSTHKPVVHKNMKIRNRKHWKVEPTCAATWIATTLGGVVTRGLRMLYLQADKIKRN